jgi:hypothetical protein
MSALNHMWTRYFIIFLRPKPSPTNPHHGIEVAFNMPSPPCNLRINRPTPTTVSFTVSTRAPLTTLTSRLIHYTALASRIIIAASIILILATKWCLWSTKEGWNHLPTWLNQSLPGQGAKFVAENAMARYLVPVSMAVLWACARRGYTGMFFSYALFSCQSTMLRFTLNVGEF